MQLKSFIAFSSAVAFAVVAVNATTPTSSIPTQTVTETVTYCPTSTPTVPACPPSNQSITLRRMFNNVTFTHFYSTFSPEVAQFETQGYVEEFPSMGRLYSTQFAGTVPLLRCIINGGKPNIEFFYTADPGAYQAAMASGCQAMPDPAVAGISQGIGYLYTSPQCGTIPLYQIFSSKLTDFLNTISLREAQGTVNDGTGNWVDRGIVGYVLPNPN